jgi:23S rRNA (pseudouridine1915-N3)-methyltransferase
MPTSPSFNILATTWTGSPPLNYFSNVVDKGANIFLLMKEGTCGVRDLLHVKVVFAGRVRNSFAAEGISEYEKRISPFARIELIDLKGKAKRGKGATDSQMVQKAGTGLKVALDPAGKPVSSEDMAVILRDTGSVGFLIGGPDGLTPETTGACDLVISLSRMTLTGEMAKLLLMEQVYRALTMLNKHPYHR